MWTNVGETMQFLPHMTGNGNHTTYKTGDDLGMVHGIVLPTLYGYENDWSLIWLAYVE